MKFRFEHVCKWKWIENENGKPQRLTILEDISMESCGDGIHAILGPSGGGKTTLLRLLNKLESPDQGRILLDDMDISTIPARQLRKDVGMVFQIPALFQGTVADNILFGPRLDKGSGLPSLQHLLETVGLGNIEPHRDVQNLSLGQQQRISFARALANNPKALLLDEPTSALDPSAAINLLDLIKRINQQMSVGIVMVTHVIQHAQRIADTICLLVSGKIVEHGSTKEFFQNPQTTVGRQFISGEL